MYTVSRVLIAVAVLALSSAPAGAVGLDAIADRLPHAIALRSTMRAVVGGATSAFREDAERLIDDKINPMLDRVDAIVRGNITHAADEAIRVLDEAERAMNSVIDHAALKTHEEINDLFAKLNATLDSAVVQLDVLLTTHLCKIAPEGKGLLVDFPILPSVDEVRVWRPAESRCWRDYLTSTERPFSQVFDGWQTYKGLICEQQFLMNEIHPDDKRSVARVAENYSRLVALTAMAQCSAKPEVDKVLLMKWRVSFERRAKFYRDLAGDLLEGK